MVGHRYTDFHAMKSVSKAADDVVYYARSKGYARADILNAEVGINFDADVRESAASMMPFG